MQVPPQLDAGTHVGRPSAVVVGPLLVAQIAAANTLIAVDEIEEGARLMHRLVRTDPEHEGIPSGSHGYTALSVSHKR
jgi:hypothetical protein